MRIGQETGAKKSNLGWPEGGTKRGLRKVASKLQPAAEGGSRGCRLWKKSQGEIEGWRPEDVTRGLL